MDVLTDTRAAQGTVLGEHEIERHIVRGGCDPLHFLCGITDADEQRHMPERAQTPEAERAIVVAAAHAEPSAVTIEADERQEHDIEQAHAREPRPFGLGDAEAIAALSCGERREMHGAHAGAPIDARQIHVASPTQCERDEAGGVELLGGGGVDADALTGTKMEHAIGVARDLPGGARALGDGYGPSPRSK